MRRLLGICGNVYTPNIKQMNRVKMMQDLEALANNELFVKANLLTVKA